jgi:nucleoside 2-deoxyribosyltransferase
MIDGKMVVYLSGPITGLTYADATSWREHALSRLTEGGLHVLSPMRGKKTLEVYYKDRNLPPGGHKRPATTDRALMKRDYADCQRADIILVNFLEATERSIGSSFELGWVTFKGKFVVVCVKPDGVHNHGFVRAVSDVIVDDLDRAIDCIIEWAGSL